MKIFCENTPLTDNDCFVIFSREKSCFDFPLHTHKELELNLVLNGAGASRVIGNHMGTIGDAELVFVNGETPHAWFTDGCRSQRIQEVTLQFAPDLIDDKLLNRNSLTECSLRNRQLSKWLPLFGVSTSGDRPEACSRCSMCLPFSIPSRSPPNGNCSPI